MNDESKVKKGRIRFPDRLTIDPKNLEKIGCLLDQLTTSSQGCSPNRKEILNWILDKFPDKFSVSDLKELSELFYDEERFLRYALSEVKAARERGERKTLEEILQTKSTSVVAAKRPYRKKDKAVAETEIKPEPHSQLT